MASINWSAEYENQPRQVSNPGFVAQSVRTLKTAISERMTPEHYFGITEDTNAGLHREGSARAFVEDDESGTRDERVVSDQAVGRMDIDLTERVDEPQIDGVDIIDPAGLLERLISIWDKDGTKLEVFNWDDVVHRSWDVDITGRKRYTNENPEVQEALDDTSYDLLDTPSKARADQKAIKRLDIKTWTDDAKSFNFLDMALEDNDDNQIATAGGVTNPISGTAFTLNETVSATTIFANKVYGAVYGQGEFMGIVKDELITKDDIFENNMSLAYETIAQVSVANAGVFQTKTDDIQGEFAIRGKPSIYFSSDWLVGTTYNKKDRVDKAGNVYTCMSDGNIGIDPETVLDELDWHEVVNPTKITSYVNVEIRTSIRGTSGNSGDAYRIRLWKRTWDVNLDPVDILIDDKTISGVTNIDKSWFYTLEEGFYYYDLWVSTQGSSSSTTMTLTLKRYANDLDQYDRIRVFQSDYMALLPELQTQITAALAKSGRLTTEDYFGGDYETYTPQERIVWHLEHKIKVTQD